MSYEEGERKRKVVKKRKALGVEWEDVELRRFFIMSGLLHITEAVFTYPVDVIIARNTVSTSVDTLQFWRGAFISLSEVYKGLGTKGFYRGYPTFVLTGTPSWMVYLIVYASLKEKIQHFYDKKNGNTHVSYAEAGHTWWIPALSGAAADISGQIFGKPTEVVCLRLMVNDPRYSNGRSAFRSILKEEGVKGLYRGFCGGVLAGGCASAIWWMSYEKIKKWLTHGDYENLLVDKHETEYQKRRRKVRESKTSQMFAGALASAVSTLVLNPHYVTMIRYQTQSLGGLTSTYFSVLKDTYVLEGFRGFYRGVFPKVLFYAPYSAISALVYETIMKYSVPG